MSHRTPSDTEKNPSQPSLRLCTICDGVEAIISLVAWLSQISANAERVDLELSDALEALRDAPHESWDLVVIVPNPTRDSASPHLVEAILDAVAARSVGQLVLLSPNSRLHLKHRERARTLNGPPYPLFDGMDSFAPQDLKVRTQQVATPKSGWWRKLMEQFGRQETPDTRDFVAPVQMLGFQPAAGGSGASTLAIAMAQELLAACPGLEICLIDLDLQFGTLSTYLDLPANSDVINLYRDPHSVDADLFEQSLRTIGPGLRVMVAPDEILPVDAIDGPGLVHLLGLARKTCDLVIVDFPPVIGDWLVAGYEECDLVYMVANLDVRSTINVKRICAILPTTLLPLSKFKTVINFAPVRRDKFWHDRIKAFSAGSGMEVDFLLPDVGPQLRAACDAGALTARLEMSNPVRKVLQKQAEQLMPALRQSQTSSRED